MKICQLLREIQQNAVANVNSASQSNIIPSGSMSEVNVSHNVSTCIDVANAELSHVNNIAVVNPTSEMPINLNSLSELSLPSFVDCNGRYMYAGSRYVL
jgi:hypothetical protein